MLRKIKIKLIEECFIEMVAFTFIFVIFMSPVFASEITPNKVIKLVNSAREAEGLAPLVQNDVLMKVAQDKLNDMIENNYFAHTSPNGKTPWSWFAEENYDYQYAGENLAINFTSAEVQQEAWMKSPAHRKNILNVDYQEIGVAFGAGEINGEMSLITVQEFGVRAMAPEIPSNENNFFIQRGAGLLENGSKILPQVLAFKTKNPDTVIKTDDFKASLAKFWPIINTYLFIVALILFLGSLLLLPISFLAVAFDRIFVLYEKKRILKRV